MAIRGALRRPGFDIGRRLGLFPIPPGDTSHEEWLITSPGGDYFPPEWPVWNQGGENDCTAHAIAGAFMYLQLREQAGPHASITAPDPDDPWLSPSREFLYYEQLRLAGNFGQDSGVYTDDAIHCLLDYGVCPDGVWNTLPAEFQDDDTWTPQMQDELETRGILTEAARAKPLHAWALGGDVEPSVTDSGAAYQLRKLERLKACLRANRPFVVSLDHFSSYEAAPKDPVGAIPMPAAGASRSGSGHTVLVIGYCDYEGPGYFRSRNSKGASVGDQGYQHLPYEWLRDPKYSYGIWTLGLGPKS